MSENSTNQTEDSISLRDEQKKADFEQPLADWLRQRLPGCEQLEIGDVSSPKSTGSSSELLLLDVVWRDKSDTHRDNYVVRLEPTRNILLPAVDFKIQFDIQKAVAAEGAVPMATMRWFEPSTAIFGAPFYVMDKIDGVTASDVPPYNAAGWLAECEPQVRERTWWTSVRAMAELHQRDIDSPTIAAFRNADSVRGELELEIAYYEALYEWAREGKHYPLVEEAWDWVKANLPENESCHICWGDARMGNMLYDQNTGQCLAMLDWEMYSFGAPEKDIAYWNWFDRYLTEGFQVPRLPGWPSYDETIAEYQNMSGYRLKNLEFYDIYAPLRTLTIYVRVTSLYKKLGKSHSQLPDVEDVFTSHLLDQLLL